MDEKKLHEETLAIARSLIEKDPKLKDWVVSRFPELAESEDERIRKGLIEYFLHYPDHEITYYDLKADFVISWLEKQGEQKSAWSEEDEAIYYGVIETEQYMLDVVNGIKKFNVGNISIKEECTRELNWLESLKDRVLLQPKQEWSGDSAKIINDCISAIHAADHYSLEDKNRMENWLKALSPNSFGRSKAARQSWFDAISKKVTKYESTDGYHL